MSLSLVSREVPEQPCTGFSPLQDTFSRSKLRFLSSLRSGKNTIVWHMACWETGTKTRTSRVFQGLVFRVTGDFRTLCQCWFLSHRFERRITAAVTTEVQVRREGDYRLKTPLMWMPSKFFMCLHGSSLLTCCLTLIWFLWIGTDSTTYTPPNLLSTDHL